MLTFVDAFMKTSIRELKAHLSEYVRRASQGEIIEVTAHGREVAKLVPQDRGEGAGRLVGTPGILWRGGKPEGLARAEVMPNGIRLSDYVAEDRR